MALRKMTPIDRAIGVIDKAIKNLQLQRAELVALLPNQPKYTHVKKKIKMGNRVFEI